MKSFCNNFNYSGCGCGDCQDGCRPAKYNGMFKIEVSPYDPLTWLVTWNGMTNKVRIPATSETDTSLSTDQSNATLNYKAEQHKDTVTGTQIGELIKMGDLRDVDFDASVSGTCYELLYRKYGSCGEGCQSVQNKWYNFNINSDGAKKNAIRFVRGTNTYGCPEYLNVPDNTNQYWFAGWKTDGENNQFGYFHPASETIPVDANYRPLVMSINQTTKKPIIGPINIDPFSDAICSNFTAASGLMIATEGGNSICYYPHMHMAYISLDVWVDGAQAEQVAFDKVIATINDRRLWPQSTLDMPAHVIWENNSDGAVVPIRVRTNSSGQVIISGRIPARANSGKTKYILDGVDDFIVWYPQGV